MEAAVDRLEVKVIQAEGLRFTESGPPSAYAEVRTHYIIRYKHNSGIVLDRRIPNVAERNRE